MLNRQAGSQRIFRKKNIKYLAAFLGAILLFVVVRGILTSPRSQNTQDTQSANAIASARIDKAIPVVVSGEDEDAELTLLVENMELRNEIVIQGQKASSVDGRLFLVLNLKLVNPLESSVEVNTRDYLRISVGNGTEEWLAPDIHNDPVLVQAISTRPTRLAIPVDASVREFVLQTGEITGEKERQEIKLQ